MVAYQFPVWLRRLPATEVTQSPRRISEHAELVIFAKESQQRTKGALLKDVIAALWAISSNIAQSPDSLLSHIVHIRGQQLDKFWYSASLDDGLGVFRRTRRDVRERPGRFELGITDQTHVGWGTSEATPTCSIG